MGVRERIYNYFKSTGLTQKEFGERLGYKPSHISMLLNEREPTVELLTRIGKAFPDADIKYLLLGEDDVHAAVNAPSLNYGKANGLVEELEVKLKELKDYLTRV